MEKSVMLLAVSAVLLLSAAACTSQPSKEADYTDPQVLEKMISSTQSYILLDVRTPAEYAEGHIPTALNVPLADLQADLEKNLPPMEKDDLVILYCRSGARSGQAYKLLSDTGFTNLHDFGSISRYTGKTVSGNGP